MDTINPDTRVIDLTVGQLMDLINKAPTSEANNVSTNEKRLAYGMAGIAQIFNCSLTTANRIKQSGKIDKAISQFNRVITTDIDLALELMKKE